jgi:pimeloyl-ACP methyl ester carboxylesterase
VPELPRGFASASDAEKAVRAANPNAPGDLVPVAAATATRPGADGLLVPKHDPFFFSRWPFRRDDHWAELPRLAIPSLFVHAAGSFVRHDVMAEMASRVPGARLACLPDTTHVVPVDNPGGLAAQVAGFLARA